MKINIPGSLPGLNEYIQAERTHRQKGAALKRDAQELIEWEISQQIDRPLREPVTMHYTWVERDRRRDKDNISSMGRKLIQDAMVAIGALKNDGWSNIEGFTDNFSVDAEDPRIEIDIEEAPRNAHPRTNRRPPRSRKPADRPD